MGVLQSVKNFDMNPPSYDKTAFFLRTNLIKNSNSYPVLFLSVPLACQLRSID